MAYRDRILGLSGLQSFWEFDEAAGATSFADSQGSVTLTGSGTITAGDPGVITDGGNSLNLPNTVSLGTCSAGNNYGFESAASSTYYDPNADTADTGWTRSTGATNFGCVDDAVRQPTNASTSGDGATLSTSTSGAKTGIKFGTGTYDASATYKLWVYAAAGSKRKIQVETSTNDGTSWNAIADLQTSTTAGWVSLDVTSLITSQATLDAFAARFTATSTGGGGTTAATIYAAYLSADTAGTALPFTVETWISIDAAPDANQRRILFKRGGTPTTGYDLSYISTEWHFGRWVGGTEIAAKQTGITVTTGTYHVVGTYDGSNSKLYVNGSLIATGASDTRALNATGTNLYVGSSNGAIAQAMNGHVDGIAIYNRALTATEVADNYTAGTASSGTSLSILPAAETDVAQALSTTVGPAVSASIAAALETNTAQALSSTVGPALSASITAALETDGAQPLGFTKAALSASLNPAVESDLAQALGFTKSPITRTLGPALESDLAQLLAFTVESPITVNLIPATEADAAQPVSFTQQALNVSIAAALESDTAVVLTFSQGGAPINVTLLPAAETDAAQALSFSQAPLSLSIAPATEADVAQVLGITQTPISRTLTPATETDLAQAIGFAKAPVTVTLNPASETNAAQLLSFTLGSAIQASISPASEADLAQSLAVSQGPISVTLVPATETDRAVALVVAGPPSATGRVIAKFYLTKPGFYG